MRSEHFRGLKMHSPATRWEDGLPCGNGIMGALLFGGAAHELIVLNHEALWRSTPRPTLPDISSHLPQLRGLLNDGNYREADGFLNRHLAAAGYDHKGVDPFQPLGDLEITTRGLGAFAGYRRTLDFSTGVARVSWRDENSGACRRELFVSGCDDVIVLRLRSERPLEYSVRLAAHGSQQTHGMGSGTNENRAPSDIEI